MANYHAGDGTNLHEKVWAADGNAVGTAVLVHGYGEHIGRYEHVADALKRAGFHVRGIDLRGHGQSGGVRGYCDHFKQFLDDVEQLIGRARENAPDLPLFLIGHSFGGLITTRYLIEHPDAVSGLVLSSPYFALKLKVPKAKIIAGQIMSKVYGKMALPAGLKGSDVTRDPDIAAAYDRDPLNNKNATARWFTETSAAQAFVLANASRLTLPLLLMAGADDPIADTKVAEEVFAKVASTDKALDVLAGQKHEIFNELADDRKKTLQRMTEWLKAHADAARGKLRAHSA